MPLDSSRIRALCFDIDGTLRDTDDQYVAMLDKFIQPFAFLFADRDSRKVARRLVMQMEGPGNFLISLPDRWGIDEPIWRLLQGLAGRKKHKQANHSVIEGTKTVLTALSAKYPMAIVTARSHRAAVDFLDFFDLTKHFACIVSGLTAKRSKPHPAPIFWAARQMDVPPETCLMIGDTRVDVLAGKAAGAQTIGVLSGFGEESDLRKSGADEILASIADLPGLILQN